MIVTCPSCEAKYRVEASALEKRGGRVKCASCAHVWTVADDALTLDRPVAPAARKVEVEPETAPRPDIRTKPAAAIRARAATRAKRNRLAVEGAGWAGVAACLVLLAGAVVTFRVDVVTLWPRTAGAYAAVGFDINPYGLAVEELTAELVNENGVPALVVEGLVRNIAGRDRPTLPLEAQILDSEGQVLTHWPVALIAAELPADGEERFRTRFDAPPESGARVEVVIASARAAGGESSGAADHHDHPSPPTESHEDSHGTPQGESHGSTAHAVASAHGANTQSDHGGAAHGAPH